MSSVSTEDLFSVQTEYFSSVETECMSAVKTEDMSPLAKDEMSSRFGPITKTLACGPNLERLEEPSVSSNSWAHKTHSGEKYQKMGIEAGAGKGTH